jgi:glycosyltransferase involved in cell wall biosynthesis
MASTAPAVGQDEHLETKTGLLASVVVPVRNRSEDIRELLDALAAQTIPRERFEVLIGDDGSTDGLTNNLATGDGWIQVLWGPPMNSYAARNRAASAARSPVLAFCDSDCKPEPDWLEKGLGALEDADAVAGGIRFVLPRRRTLWTLLDIETTKDHESQVPMGNAETANLFVRRDLFTQLDGFDDTLPEHGDFDFASRCVASGGRLVYAPEALVWHPARERALPFLRMVWVMNRWYAAREARAGRLPVALKLRCWIPALSVVRSRRRMGFSLGLDRRTLNANGVRPRLRDDLRALPAIYLLLPYLRGFAQLRGCIDGRRMR